MVWFLRRRRNFILSWKTCNYILYIITDSKNTPLGAMPPTLRISPIHPLYSKFCTTRFEKFFSLFDFETTKQTTSVRVFFILLYLFNPIIVQVITTKRHKRKVIRKHAFLLYFFPCLSLSIKYTTQLRGTLLFSLRIRERWIDG